MNFTGINYQKIASSRSLTLDLDNLVLYNSGLKYSAGQASGFHFGFSGTSNSVSFSGVSGKLYDPEGRVVYGYAETFPFSLSFSCNETNYDYYINNELRCSKGLKSNIEFDKFFFNCNGLTADVNFNIYGSQIDYSLTFPESFSGDYLTGNFENKSNSKVIIFTGSLTAGNTDYFSTDLINNITINANTSGAVVLTNLLDQGGINSFVDLTLNTNFGDVSQTLSIYYQ